MGDRKFSSGGWNASNCLFEREAQATATTAPSETVTDNPVATFSLNTYTHTETVDTNRVSTTPPTDPEAENQEPSQPEESEEPLPEIWTPQTGEEVLIYTPLFENKWSWRGIVQKIAQHATDCWEILVNGRVRKVWDKDWLLPSPDST